MPYLRAKPVATSESSGTVSFVVFLDVASVNEIKVNYGVDAGTAVYSGSGIDFRTQSGTLTFAPGETSKTLTVQVVDNTAAESTELFWLDLNTPVNATVEQRWTPGFIFDNDATAGTPVLKVSSPVVDESGRSADFFVWLSKPSTLPVSVSYSTADDTATGGQDYQEGAGLLNFAPGEMVKTVSIDLINDSLAETQEYFRLVLANASGATLAQPSASAEIGANDGPIVGAPYVSARAIATAEGETSTQFVISLSAPSGNEVRVNYGLDSGTAVYSGSGQDFQSYSGTLVFAPGETTKTLPVVVIDNSTAESTEVFWLDLNTPVNAVINQRWTPALLFDNDGTSGTPVIEVTEPVVDESGHTASFFVSLSRPSTGVVSVNYATADDTATAGADYRALSGSLSFQPGEVLKAVQVDIIDDSLAETQEYFRLAFSNPTGATLAQPAARAEIGPSDSATVGAPYIHARTVAAGESDTTAQFVITLSAPSTNEVRVNFGLDSGTAVYSGSGQDFQATSGTLVFAPGETTKTLPLVVTDNSVAEGTETFRLDLNTPVNAVVPQRWTQGFVFDNDGTTGTPAISVSDVVADESSGVAAFRVSLSRPSNGIVSVDFHSANDTAAAGSDFHAVAGSLSFQPGEMVKTLLVDIVDDSLSETDEWFQMLLSNPAGATLGDAVGAALIGRSDGQAVSQPQITSQPIFVSEADAATHFIVQLSAPSSNEVRVNFGLNGGTAAYSGSGQDFQAYSGTLVFAPGETTKMLPFNLINNTTAEGDEAFTLDLNSPVNATVPQRYTTATIIDDDGASTVYSGGISNDLYPVSGALDRIAESPGGGIDTVISTISYTLPDNVENLVLTGSALNALGNAGNNVFRGTAANNVFDGKAGVDTVVYAGPAAAYTVTGSIASRTVTSAADGSDTLLSIERLQFSDRILAQDTTATGNTYLAYAMLNAAFDTAPDTALLSQWTAQLDRLGSLSALAQAMINAYAPGVSDEALVAYLWGTIVETPIPLDALSTYVGLVRSGSYTQAGLVELVTTLDLNTVEIAGIVGQTLQLDPAWFPPPGA